MEEGWEEKQTIFLIRDTRGIQWKREPALTI